VKTVLFNCSQYVQRIKRELEDDQSGISGLIGNIALGPTIVIKIMMKHEFYTKLTAGLIEGVDVLTSLKSKTLPISSCADCSDVLEFLCQIYLICSTLLGT